MDFSDDWRSLWPVSGVFAAPKLIPPGREATFGPLLFSPSSPPLHLLASPSLALRFDPPLPPSFFLDGLRSFFRCPDNDGFLPSAAIDSLAADVAAAALSSSATGNIDPIPCNNLVALRCRSGSSMILFFPTGENSHSVGYIRLTFGESMPVVRVDQKGDVFKQSEGFKNPYHRILKISVVPMASESSWSSPDVLSASPGKPLVEGFLVAATLYSLNWFRVETRVLESGEERPFLVPLAKQGFESPVKHVCWSPHLAEESAALLESGELCWFNLDTKRGGTIRVIFSEDDPGEWLSCEFGGQPWTVIVTCSKAIILVDLRSTRGSGQRVLAKIGKLNLYDFSPPTEKNDRFLAVCKASFNEFHIAAVTEHQLHLFDIRKPSAPILTWNHSLKYPRQIFMFRLSELRSSDEFQWASEYGFAVLVGSLWNDEFSLFFFGPKEPGLSSGSSLYSWELPSCLCLSSRQCVAGDKLVDMLSKENCAGGVKWQQWKNILAGFCVVPNDLLTTYPVSPGFAIIRLTLSGKLEMQWFQASTRLSIQELDVEEESKTEYPNVFLCCNGKKNKRDRGWRTFKRPGVDAFLEHLAKFYEIVVYSDQLQMYVDPVIDRLDQKGCIRYRLSRPATKYENGKHYRDLSKLNRDPSRVLYISAHALESCLQPENSVPIKPWKLENDDTALVDLIPFLEYVALHRPADIRPVLASYQGRDIASEFIERSKEHQRRMQEQKQHGFFWKR